MKANRSCHHWASITALFLLTIIILAGCRTRLILVPQSPAQDRAPTIKISNFVPGGEGAVDKETVEASGAVYATVNTEIMFFGSAENPGGVKTFSLTVSQGSSVLYSAQTAAIPDANNKVPTVLSILGGDGAGGAGGKVAFLVTLSRSASVSATATNFNGMTTTILINYIPLRPLSPAISVTPTSIEAGGAATLNWSATNATEVTLSPPVGTGASGSIVVSPSASTTYKLTAKQPFHGPKAAFPGQGVHDVMKSVSATLNVTPPQPATGGISGTYFFDALGSERFDITVLFTGTLITASGTVGKTNFSVPIKASNLVPALNFPVSFSESGLRKGTWRVRAQPSAVAGLIECNVVVPPGIVSLSVAGGAGPKCSP